jgi:shikimate dehydrogenase
MPALSDLDVFRRSQGDVCVGLIGSGIQASLTPAMHMREGRAHGLDYEYRLIDTDAFGLTASALPTLISAAEDSGFAGLNITYPLKQAVLGLLTDLSDDARSLGAVNTVVFDGGRRVGHNTDWWGFATAFRQSFTDVRHEIVVLLGAGGAGSAVAYALLTCGTRELRIVETDNSKGLALAATLADRFPSARVTGGWESAAALHDADGLVNATPVGMAKLPGLPLAAKLVTPNLWLIDIIYFPLETELLRTARNRGCRSMNGGGMAVYQAVKAFELFSGRTANSDRMRAHFFELAQATQDK